MTQYKLVPVEPTEAMLNASGDEPGLCAIIWAAMLSAAPSPDGEEVGTLRRIVHDTLGYTSTNDAKFQALAAAIAAMRPTETHVSTLEAGGVVFEKYGPLGESVRPTLSEEDRARVREARAKLPTARRHIETMDVTGAISHRLGKDGEVCPEYCNEFVLEMTEFVDAAEAALSLIDKLAGEG